MSKSREFFQDETSQSTMLQLMETAPDFAQAILDLHDTGKKTAIRDYGYYNTKRQAPRGVTVKPKTEIKYDEGTYKVALDQLTAHEGGGIVEGELLLRSILLMHNYQQGNLLNGVVNQKHIIEAYAGLAPGMPYIVRYGSYFAGKVIGSPVLRNYRVDRLWPLADVSLRAVTGLGSSKNPEELTHTFSVSGLSGTTVGIDQINARFSQDSKDYDMHWNMGSRFKAGHREYGILAVLGVEGLDPAPYERMEETMCRKEQNDAIVADAQRRMHSRDRDMRAMLRPIG